jgi:type II secretory pathway pseudopilin PulG
MTLIQLIGVLAVIAILAAIILPLSIRKLDQIAGDQESASLKSLADALQSSVLRDRYVPCHTNWAQTIAARQGINVSDVTTNLRRQPRVFLIHPELQIGSRVAGEDYLQDTSGSAITITNANGNPDVIPPRSPRMILLSSIGVPLPAGVTTGVAASTSDFNGIWDAADGTLPAGNLWTGWSGARDLKVQRINLAPLFVRITLSSYLSAGDGRYSVDLTAVTNTAPSSSPREAYYIQNTVLNLITYTNTLQVRQVLSRDISFVYMQDVWRTEIGGMLGGMDIGSIVDRYLRAPHNPTATYTNDHQMVVVQAMMDYMQAYQNWEAIGFGNNALRTAALAAQDAMMDAVQEQYKDPQNTPPEVICP